MKRRRRTGWEGVVELSAVATLAVPTSLLLFAADLLWRDGTVAGTVLLGAFTVPPLLALWLVERRRRRQRRRVV
ncbi:hypothetical protein ACI2K4_33025 [Micromonospora sp. NPDC050397]|uniref:hypothetical protein n=1 Tax=Micromonospora sp. NPDC050397 TaxID=3364279 RepID=UPI00384B13A0